MYTYIIIFIIISMLIVAFYNTFIVKHNRKEQQKAAEQPTHFDLLDDNGNPIPLSDDRARSSSNVPVGSDATTQSIRYFCIKDKGYHVSVWPKVQGFQGIDYIEFNIAGITHGEHVDEYLGEFAATLEPDPANPYDQNAIKIVTSEGHRIGYVPKDQTQYVRDFTTLPCRCYCYIGTNDGMYFTDCYITNKDK